MKQKIVIQVQVRCRKCRSKAMSIAACTDGVTSVAIEGDGRDKLVVIGDGTDAATLALNLSKKLGHANLLTVEAVGEKKDKGGGKGGENPAGKQDDKDKKEGKDTAYMTTLVPYYYPQCYCQPYPVVYDPCPSSSCIIM